MTTAKNRQHFMGFVRWGINLLFTVTEATFFIKGYCLTLQSGPYCTKPFVASRRISYSIVHHANLLFYFVAITKKVSSLVEQKKLLITYL
jgi:hypothetical protein